MTVYTTIPQDDSNLDITITEAPDLVTLDLNSASFNLIGAVNSINGLVGDVTLELGLPEAEVQTLIDDSISAIDYPVDSVNGQTGDVVLTTNEISEDVNLYYTDARVDDYLNSGSITSIAFADTTISWNADDGTLEFPVNPDVTLQIGQENLIHVKNLSGTTLTNGTVVYVTGASGSKLTIDRADSAMEGTSAATIAIMTQELGNNAVGYATTEGLVRGLNTAAYGEGAAIYLNSNGAFSTTKPVTPQHLVPVGWVVRSHASEGSIFVHINNGQELEELHDVLITTPTDGQGIVWDAANGYWKNGDVTVDLTGYATEAYVDAAIPTLTSELTNDSGFITGYTESDPVYSASVAAGITAQNVTDWNSAFAWGNHALAGYLTSETDSQTLSFSNPNLSISNGNTVDLSGLTPDLTGYATESYVDIAISSAISSVEVPGSTDDLPEGVANLYYTDTRVGDYLTLNNYATTGYVDAAVFSGDYNDLTNTPAIPGVLNDLTNVNTAPNDGDVLTYDLATSSWLAAAPSGGGASALGDLTDVTLTGLSDGDLIRYNGTAGEWQNTNLGLTLTPTLSISDKFTGATNICTITNWGDYDDPAVFAQVKDSGGSVVVTNANITNNGDGTLEFIMPAVGTDYVIEVQVQDFGDLASDTGSATFDTLEIPAGRYYRIKFINATAYNMIDRLQLYTGSSQTGTLHPTTPMTSNTAPSPYVASSDHQTSASYAAYEAFDNVAGGVGSSWWNLSSPSYPDSWVQIDVGSNIQIASFRLNPPNNASYISGDGWLIYSSDTGAFAGEEILRATIYRVANQYEYTVG